VTGAFLAVSRIVKRFGSTTVLDRLDFSVGRGDFVSLLGPSGCGKTTLLRLIAGLLRADGGTITLDGRDLTALPAHKRNVGVVFQNYALFPHLTVAGNVAFGLAERGVKRAERAGIVSEMLAMVRMEAFADRPIQALSGGQQQRVAVARALAVRPPLLLLDEPFSALDRKLRETMQIELRRLLRDRGITAIFVTHDQDEAMVMSDRIAVMNEGAIEQFADPTTLYARPATPFALGFVGQSTRLFGRVTAAAAGIVTVETAYGPVSAPGHFTPGAPVMIGVRPERIRLGEAETAGGNTISTVLADAVFTGANVSLIGRGAHEAEEVLAVMPAGTVAIPEPGTTLRLSWPVAETLLYPSP
jgi:putative spermidine/putrescine transport system ATP-binding protein